MTPKTLLIYKHQKELEEARETELTDVSEWMTGAYISKAISCFLSNDETYPEKNVFFNADQFELTDDDIEEIISENTQIAAANFSEWAKVANESKGR